MSTKELERGRIIPDVVDSVNPHSKTQISVTYGSIPVILGELITPKDSSSTPTVHITGADPHAEYTLICTDPDAPDPANPTKGEYVHWIVTNIKQADVKTGTAVLPYVGPAPPIGIHRYIFLLYKQAGPVDLVDPTEGKRFLFKVREVAEEYDLGEPEACIYFTSVK